MDFLVKDLGWIFRKSPKHLTLCILECIVSDPLSNPNRQQQQLMLAEKSSRLTQTNKRKNKFLRDPVIWACPKPTRDLTTSKRT